MSAFLLVPGTFPFVAVQDNQSDVAYAAGCGGETNSQTGLSSMMGKLLSGNAQYSTSPRESSQQPQIPREASRPSRVHPTPPPSPAANRLTDKPPQGVRHSNTTTASVVSDNRKSAKKSAPAIAVGKIDSPIVYWKDDMKLRYVPGGKVTLSGQTLSKSAETVPVKSFYMDETPVTNHQYVDFLNAVLPKLKVRNGVVWSKDQIWLLLGEVKRGYQPIVFANGKFTVSNAQHAACPVLRVTAYGAAAYAAFYGKRLPTEAEWFHAVEAGAGTAQHLPIPSPVMLYQRDALGIRALTSNMGEWTVRPAATTHSRDKEQPVEYLILRDAPGHPPQKSRLNPGIQRHPWEAFADVGFRCVLPVQ